MEKKCRYCGKIKPIEEFRKNKSMKDGYLHKCRECDIRLKLEYRKKHRKELAEKSREYRKNNRDACLERSRTYYQNNKEGFLKGCRIYYENNKEKIKEKSKIYYENNKKEILEKNKLYRQTPKGKEINHEKRRRRRAKCKNTNITTGWLMSLKENTKTCCICGEKMNNILFDKKSINLDHIIPLCVGGMHTKDNVRFICFECNIKRPKDGSDAMLTPK